MREVLRQALPVRALVAPLREVAGDDEAVGVLVCCCGQREQEGSEAAHLFDMVLRARRWRDPRAAIRATAGGHRAATQCYLVAG